MREHFGCFFVTRRTQSIGKNSICEESDYKPLFSWAEYTTNITRRKKQKQKRNPKFKKQSKQILPKRDAFERLRYRCQHWRSVNTIATGKSNISLSFSPFPPFSRRSSAIKRDYFWEDSLFGGLFHWPGILGVLAAWQINQWSVAEMWNVVTLKKELMNKWINE